MQETLQADILELVGKMRRQFGYEEQNFKKYHAQLTAMLPNLRKIIAPHHRNQAKPFVYKSGDQMVIFSDKLLQEVAVEAERALASGGEYMILAQSSGAIRHRRRAMQRYQRAIERYSTLSELAKQRSTQNVQCQVYALLAQAQGAQATENDDFFEAIAQFSQALRFVNSCQADEQAKEYFAREIQQKLDHCMYMATVFADGDQAVIYYIQQLVGAARTQVEVVKITSEDQSQMVDCCGELVKLPEGNAGKVLRRVLQSNAAIMEKPVDKELADLWHYYLEYAAEHANSQLFLLPPFYAMPALSGSTTRPSAVKSAFRAVTARINAVSNVHNIAKQFSERSRASDTDKLRKILDITGQQLQQMQSRLAGVTIVHVALSLVSARFYFKGFNFQKSFYICSKSKNLQTMQVFGCQQGGFEAVLAGLFYSKLACIPSVNVDRNSLVLQAAALLRKGVQDCKGAALGEYERAVVYVCGMPQVAKGLELAGNLEELRKTVKAPYVQEDYFAYLGVVLPNPIYFDAVPELIELDDLFV